MGVAMYVVLERPIDGLDSDMNGKYLGDVPFDDEQLAEIAQTLGVQSLHGFYSSTPEEVIEMMMMGDQSWDGEMDSVPEEIRRKAPPTTWFPARDGLATASALRQYLQSNPGVIAAEESRSQDAQAGFIEDLQDIERILERADQEGVLWYLGMSD